MQGSRYVIGQHGAQYGTSSTFSHSPTVEETIADVFITWGWMLPSSNTHPVCNLKTVHKRHRQQIHPKNVSDTQLLLVQDGPGYPYQRGEDVNHLFSINLAAQFQLVDHLPSEILSMTSVRLQRDPEPVKARIARVWNDRYGKHLKIDYAHKSIEKTHQVPALTVYCYDSTGFLENILTDHPTILYIPGHNLRINNYFLPYYEKLIEVGLLQRDPIETARFIARIWDNPYKWWNSPDVKTERNNFAQEFSRNIMNPIRTLRQVLRNNAS